MGGDGRERGGGGGGSRKRRERKSCTQMTCKYFVIQVATISCTAVRPEVGYQGAALQHLQHKDKKTKSQKQSCIYVYLMTVQLVSVTLQTVWETPQICDLCSYLGIH